MPSKSRSKRQTTAASAACRYECRARGGGAAADGGAPAPQEPRERPAAEGATPASFCFQRRVRCLLAIRASAPHCIDASLTLELTKLTVRNAALRIEFAMLGIPLVQAREMSGDDAYVFLYKERARGEAAPRKTAAQLRELLTVAPAAAATAAAETGATRGDDSGDSDIGERGKRATATPPQNTHKEKRAGAEWGRARGDGTIAGKRTHRDAIRARRAVQADTEI